MLRTAVLLVDDQAVVRAGLRTILETDEAIEVVGEADDGQQAVTLTQALDPDVVIMDIRMPVLDGIKATERLMSTGTRTKVLMLTTYGLDEYVYAALRAGAAGFSSRPNRRHGCARRCTWSPPVMRCSARRQHAC